MSLALDMIDVLAAGGAGYGTGRLLGVVFVIGLAAWAFQKLRSR